MDSLLNIVVSLNKPCYVVEHERDLCILLLWTHSHLCWDEVERVMGNDNSHDLRPYENTAGEED